MSYTKHKDYTAKDCYSLLQKDRRSPKYQIWLREAKIARKFIDNTISFDDLDISSIDRDNVAVTHNTVRKIVHMIYGKAFGSPIRAKVVPFEGDYAEEAVSKICECIFKFEESQRRGIMRLNYLRELKRSVLRGLVSGMLYFDSRLDQSLATPLFYQGLPLYWNPDPIDVIMDCTAANVEQTWHRHIIHSVLPEILEGTFEVSSDWFTRATDNEGGDPERNSGKIDVVETQYKVLAYDDLYQLSNEQIAEIYLNPRKSGFYWKREIKQQADVLKSNLPEFSYFDLKKFLAHTPKIRTQSAAVYNRYHVGGQELNKEPYLVGNDFSMDASSFFPNEQSPYGFGLPYYLKDISTMQMIAKTVELRQVMVIDRPRKHRKGKDTEHIEEQYRHGSREIVYKPEDVDEDVPLAQQFIFENTAQNLPLVAQFAGMLQNDLDSQFASHPELERGYAGASGKFMQTISALAGSLLSIFWDELNWFIPNQYDRSLSMAAMVFPVEALLVIAGENDKERAQLIQSGQFKQRLSNINVDAQLDLTSEEDRKAQKEVAAMLLKSGALHGAALVEGLGILGYREPVKMARAIEQGMAQFNQELAMGKKINELGLTNHIMNMLARVEAQSAQQ